MKDPTLLNIRRAACRTIDALQSCGYNSYLFGSTACHIWGMRHRNPNDIDIVVLTDDDPEVIKSKLAERNKRFFLSNAKDSSESHHLLYYAISYQKPRIIYKVDIFISGMLHIPVMGMSRRKFPGKYNIPVMPFLPLLLLKLMGWTDHRNSEREDFRSEVSQDEADIEALLDMLDTNDHLSHYKWLPKSFITRSARSVKEFVEEFPDTAVSWGSLGFNLFRSWS